MKRWSGLFLMAAMAYGMTACQSGEEMPAGAPTGDSAMMMDDKMVEAGCAKCVYAMEGQDECAMAIMVDGKHMLVEGSDPALHDKICKTARKAEVSGTVVDGKLMGTEFEIED